MEELKLENEKLDDLLKESGFESEYISKIKIVIKNIISIQDNIIDGLNEQIKLIQSLPNNNFVFIVSNNSNNLKLEWKSLRLEGINSNLLLYNLESLNIKKYLKEAENNNGEMININNIFLINDKKYYLSLYYNNSNGYYNIYLKPALIIKQNIIDTLDSILELAELRDPETKEHLLRISTFSRLLSDKLNEKNLFIDIITSDFKEDIELSSPLHDLGKIGIPDNILFKKGKLSEEEFEIMKLHTEKGGKLISSLIKKYGEINILNLAKNIAMFHHEKYDGNGYPYGLKGNEIPLEARIVALVDVFDALKSKRSYKESFSDEETKTILLNGKGKHFDPLLLDVFMENWDLFISLRKQISDDENI